MHAFFPFTHLPRNNGILRVSASAAESALHARVDEEARSAEMLQVCGDAADRRILHQREEIKYPSS